MAISCYDVGDQVRLSLTLANSGGTAVDPTTLALTVKPGNGTATTYTYAAGSITKSTTGSYYVDYTVPSHSGGTYYYKWLAAGSAIGMAQGSFAVRVDETS